MMEEWRLIESGAADGPWNMAVDEVLLSLAGSEGGAPVLRLYSFDPPAITVGYHQDPARVLDLDAVRRDRMDLSRRITGGRALLHAGELTYSVTAPLGGPFGRTLGDTFLSIAEAVAEALRASGVDAEVSRGSAGRGGGMRAPCIASTGRREISVGARKISGSAQRRTRSAFIQHGSIFLRSGSERISEYLAGKPERLEMMMTTVEEETGRPADPAAFGRTIAEAFSDRFGARFARDRLPDRAVKRAGELAARKRAELAGPRTRGTKTV